MSSGVVVEGIEVARPARAARRGAAIALQAAGRARPTLLLVVAWAGRPGLTAAPWTLHGTLAAANDRGLQVEVIRIGAAGPHREDTVSLVVPGARQPMAIPRRWVGAHACLLTPCLHDRRQGLGLGPTHGALAALARAATPQTLTGAAAVGAWIAGHVFASMGVLVDGTWAASQDLQGLQLTAAGCLLASGDLDADRIDARAAALVAPAPDRRGMSLAERSIDALWHRPAPFPAVPGPLAHAWHAYPEHSAEGSP